MGKLPAPTSAAFRFSPATSLYVLALGLTAVLAFAVRLLPLRWGAYLSEFDPYWHYYVSQRVVEHGFLSVFGWVDTRTWFPYGRPVDVSTPMGLPYTVAAFYFLLRGAGLPVSLLDVAIFLPPAMAALTTLAAYFLGKDYGGRPVGLLTALFLALNGAYISRTTLGFLKHETVGVFAIVLASFLFLRAISQRRSGRGALAYAVLAGLAVAYLNISWGAFLFMTGLIPLFAIVAVLLGRYSDRLFLAYSVTVGLSLLLSVPFPRTGFAALTSPIALILVAAFLVLLLNAIVARIGSRRLKLVAAGVFVVIITAGFFGAVQIAAFAALPGKILAVIDPTQREGPAGVIIGSVAEHRMSTWATFYTQFGGLMILAPLGFFFALKRKEPKDLYFILAGLASLYFASSFVRLTLIMAPMFSILAAYGFVSLIRPLAQNLALRRESHKARRTSRAAPVLGVIFILILSATLVPSFVRAVEAADAPATIASSSAPLREFRGDWLDALAWIDRNVPKGEPILSWWDYGYWIAIGGNSTSIADNATLNTTQIATIGKILLSNESVAVDLARRHFGAKYILVFVTTAPTTGGHVPWGFGDEGKWVFMADIANGFFPEISRQTVDRDGNGFPDEDTLLGKAILYAVGLPVEFEKSEVVYVSPSHSNLNRTVTTTQVIILKAKD